MMRFFKCILICFLLNSCASTHKENYGAQTIRILDKGQQVCPEQVLLYYDNYLVERIILTKQITLNNSTQSISYDTLYCLVNFNNDSCVTYNQFSEQAHPIDVFKLENKRQGIQFDQPMDSALDYSPEYHLKDTTVDGSSYRYFTMKTKSSPQQVITCYLVFDTTPLFHFNKRIDKDYNGVVVRMDMENKEVNEQTSIRMTIKPHSLTNNQLKVINSWIRAGNWLKGENSTVKK